eukprot:364182-Chlamydomonas_euryale.AAC.5
MGVHIGMPSHGCTSHAQSSTHMRISMHAPPSTRAYMHASPKHACANPLSIHALSCPSHPPPDLRTQTPSTTLPCPVHPRCPCPCVGPSCHRLLTWQLKPHDEQLWVAYYQPPYALAAGQRQKHVQCLRDVAVVQRHVAAQLRQQRGVLRLRNRQRIAQLRPDVVAVPRDAGVGEAALPRSRARIGDAPPLRVACRGGGHCCCGGDVGAVRRRAVAPGEEHRGDDDLGMFRRIARPRKHRGKCERCDVAAPLHHPLQPPRLRTRAVRCGLPGRREAGRSQLVAST